MARAKTGGGPGKIPIGDEYLKNVPEDELESMISAIPSCKEIPKEMLILTAALKRKRHGSISGIARDMGRPYATVYGWLLRVHERGLDGRTDRTSPNRKRILDEGACRLILEWVSGSPLDYNFESGAWQVSMIIRMIRDTMGMNVQPRTLRRALRRAGISFRKPRPIPHNSASEPEQAEFRKNAQGMVDRQAAAGHIVFYQDEMTVRLAAVSARGWMPRGASLTVKTGFFSKKSIKVFGVLGRDRLHVMPAGAANSTTFRIFLEALRQEYGKVTFITDNASYHKSRYVRDYLESTNGDVMLIHLPPYTPQLNPIEIQWKVIKERLAGRYFATIEELEDAIVRLVETGEVRPVRLAGVVAA